jgi:Helicase associated domain
VPHWYTVDGYRLGGWVTTQRNFRAREKLDKDRQQRLSNVPGWTWDARADQWEEGFSHLLRYIDQYGHARVLRSYTIDGYRLGKWLGKQRHRHSEGTLDADRERRLQELPGWTWNANDRRGTQR